MDSQTGVRSGVATSRGNVIRSLNLAAVPASFSDEGS